jgi:hypothetical protein
MDDDTTFRSMLPPCTCEDTPSAPCARHPLTTGHKKTLPLSYSESIAGARRVRTNEDRKEAYNRAGVVRTILERCHAELLALQCIPHLTADDVNELGAAKGFVERAMLAIGRLPL